jgi:hypothetical protein
MTERELWVRHASLYQQIHVTVIYEDEILQKVSMQKLYAMRDNILDEIILVERKLKIRI